MEDYLLKLKMQYLQEEAEEQKFLEELGRDHSLENIERVIRNRIYSKDYKDESNKNS